MADLDLTPESRPDPESRRSIRNWVIMGVFSLIAGSVLFYAITGATVYYRNVDEAIAQKSALDGEVFRIQGTVVEEPVNGPDNALLFTISYGGADAAIRHIGDEPSSLFAMGQPVVAEGQWVGDEFESSLVLVKHNEEYVEDNPDRVEYDVEETERDEAISDPGGEG